MASSGRDGWREVFDHALSERRTQAIALAVALTEEMPAVDVVCDVLARVQCEAGDAWEDGRLSVDDVHRVSGVTDGALAAVADTPRSLRSQGPVLYACAPGEWHVLAARMASAALSLDGWQVTFAGANTTPDRLRPMIERQRPVAVGLSASMAGRIPATRDLIQVAQAAGVPTFVGGRSFNGYRARVVGANAYVADPREVTALLREWQGHPPAPPSATSAPGEGYADLVLEGENLRQEIEDAVLSGSEAVGVDGERRRQLHLGLALVLDALAASVYLRDESVFVDFVRWSQRLAVARGFPEQAARDVLEAMTASLAARVPAVIPALAEARRLLDRGLG
jgi:methanogenic corrinoid protein MtbC1